MSNSMEAYVHTMCEPVISRHQAASLLFVPQDNLNEVLNLIEQAGLKTHVHVEGQGVASVYLYLDHQLANTLRELSSIGLDQPEYYQQAAQLLGIDPTAFTQWSAQHALGCQA